VGDILWTGAVRGGDGVLAGNTPSSPRASNYIRGLSKCKGTMEQITCRMLESNRAENALETQWKLPKRGA